MAHLALYREFRPQRFADVVGQQHITRTLRNALIQNRIHHAYLLSGPRGTGKTTVARILAKAANCLDPHDGEPCNACSSCLSIQSGETMDVIEIDAASNRGVDEIRDLRDKVRYAPAELRYKVYIIDEVHMLTEPAFNALLKTLEEPPSYVLFILATTEKHKLPVTIVSRCQSFEYHRLSTQEIVSRLEEVCQSQELKASSEALTAIARQADGGMRDALSLLDQVTAYAVEGQIKLEDTLHVLGSAPIEQFLKLDQFLTTGDVGGALTLLDELVRQGKDLRQLVRDYLGHMRDLLLLELDPSGKALDLPAQAIAALQKQASVVRPDQLLAAIRLFAQLESDLRFSSSPRLLVEVGLIRLAGLYSGKLQEEVATAPPTPPTPKHRATPAISKRTGTGPLEPKTAERSKARGESRPDPAPSSAGSNPVVQDWDRVLDEIRRSRPSTHTLLTSARIVRLRGKTVILVAPNDAFAQLLNRPDDRAAIEKAMSTVGLGNLQVEAVGPDDPAARSEPNLAPESPTETAEGNLVDIARRVFPKDLVLEVNEEDET